jgi:hypothetical protein
MPGAFIESLESRTLLSATLAGELIGTLPQTLFPAAADRLTLQMTNTGDARATGPVQAYLYVSSQAGTESILIGNASRSLSLKPGRAAQLNIKFKLPPNLADGDYFLTAQLTAKRVQTISGSMTQIIPDPSPIAVQPPTSSLVGAFAGSRINVGLDTSGDDGVGTAKLRVTNPTATAVHGTVSATVYLTTSTALNNFAQSVGVLSRRVTILPGQSKLIEGNVTIPASTAFGTYHLLAVLGPHSTGVPNAPIFATQLISVSQGADTSDDNTGAGDTGDTGDTGAGSTPFSAPTTQSGGGGATTQPAPTQPSTGPGDGGDNGDGGGDGGGGDDSGDDGGDGGDDGGGDDGAC